MAVFENNIKREGLEGETVHSNVVSLFRCCCCCLSYRFRQKKKYVPEFACSANQHPEQTIKRKIPQTFAQLVIFFKNVTLCLVIIKSCWVDYQINKPLTCSHSGICVSCSVHVITVYYVRKGSWAFYSGRRHRVLKCRRFFHLDFGR